jgi:hypothetical protein
LVGANATDANATTTIGVLGTHRSYLPTNGSDVSFAVASYTIARTTIGIATARCFIYQTTRLLNTRGNSRGKSTTLRVCRTISTQRFAKHRLLETTTGVLAIVETIRDLIKKVGAFIKTCRLDLTSNVPATADKCFGSVTSIIKRTNLLGSRFVRIELQHAQTTRRGK